LRYFDDIQLNEKMLLVGVEEMNIESLSNVLRIAATEAWFSAALVAFNCSTENRQFLY